MRLWHQSLICSLPRAQLLGQHRECCALRGLGWGRKHKTVDYVFKHPYEYLLSYHKIVMLEMQKRGYDINNEWWNPYYRGKKALALNTIDTKAFHDQVDAIIYTEHDDAYLQECLDNLQCKGVFLF